MQNEICKEFLGAFLAVPYVPNRMCAGRPSRGTQAPYRGHKKMRQRRSQNECWHRPYDTEMSTQPRWQQACSFAAGLKLRAC